MRKKWWRRKWFWGVLVLLLLGVILAAAYLHFTSPAFVRRMVLKHGSVNLRGNLSVSDARLEVFRGVELYGVRLGAPADAEPVIEVDRLRCDWNPAAFLHLDVEPRRLVLVRPNVRLHVSPEGKVNLVKLFARQRKPPPRDDPSRFERYFSDGMFAESGEVAWSAPAIFGDSRPRVISLVDVQMQRSSETFGRWNLTALLRGAPLSGTRIEGWLDFAGDRGRAVFRGRAEELAVGRELMDYLPLALRRVLSRFELAGRVTVDALLDVERGQPVNYVIEAGVRNLDARLRTKDLFVHALDASLRFDRAGCSCQDISGILWDGALYGKAERRAGAGFKVWLTLDGADLAVMASELGLADRKLGGWMNGSVKIHVDPASPERGAAEGTVELTKASLATLPILAQAFVVLQLRLPREEVFDEGECHFSVRDGKVFIESLVVSSPSVEVTGSGEIGLDRSVDMVLIVAGSKRGEAGLVKRAFRAVVGGIEREVMPPVQVRGTLDKPQARLLTLEPIKRQFRRLRDLLPFVGKGE